MRKKHEPVGQSSGRKHKIVRKKISFS